MVAVLYSPGYGAGWSTWDTGGNDDVLLFHPKLVEMVEPGRQEEITDEWMLENLGIEVFYCGGADGLAIKWLPEGTPFYVDEDNGFESICTPDILTHTA